MITVLAEKFIETLDCDVYPITLIKFLLNKKRILSYFAKATNPNFTDNQFTYSLDMANCKFCQDKGKDMLCRQHTSIERVLNADRIAYDLDTNTYFFKNEIFRMVGDKLVIVYCPHTKLISGEITNMKVRRVQPITLFDENLKKLPEYKSIRNFISGELLNQYVKCWFNKEFSIIATPFEDRNYSNWCLIPNK